MMNKYVYFFGGSKADGDRTMKNLLGGKGANLAEMVNLGIPVPPGFTISTEVCDYFNKNKYSYPEKLTKEVEENLAKLENAINKKFGDPSNPLLLSVRSGAAVSMPGMMDTILNLGLNDKVAENLVKLTNNLRFVWDAYRRLIQMFGNVVFGIESEKFEDIISIVKSSKNISLDIELTGDDFKYIVDEFKKLYHNDLGKEFPQNPEKQLWLSIEAVFKSWNNKRARKYREINSITGLLGTAVNVQAMVFGNMGKECATGVAFTRNPSNGENKFFGEFLANAQGEDVVAGIRTPQHITKENSEDWAKNNNISEKIRKEKYPSLEELMPEVYQNLYKIQDKLEKHYKDMQDIEFTIQNRKLYLLQTRTGKRTTKAAVKIAVDMVKEGMISKDTALMRIQPEQLDQLLHPSFSADEKKKAVDEGRFLAKGLPASPGAAVGKVVFFAEDAVKWKERNEKTILVRIETSPEDIAGMDAAQGILTAHGGMTCIGGDSLLLTDKGFWKAEKVFEMTEDGEQFKILSFDSKTMKTQWKNIVSAGRRISDVIEISVSQTGRSERNVLKITPDHKMLTFENRELIKKPIIDILDKNQFVCAVDKIPSLDTQSNNDKLAYLAGAIFSDGCIQVRETKGSVTFTQKETNEKKEFIETVNSYFKDVFDKKMSRRNKTSDTCINGRHIHGEVLDLICHSIKPAIVLNKISQNIEPWIMNLDESSTFNFLAGVIDGDGTFHNNRIQIFASKEHVYQGVVIACLKLGIMPNITVNRNIYNIILLERLDDILKYTKRVKGVTKEKILGTKLFSIKQLFSDISDDVNYMGRVKEAIKRNLLFDSRKIKRDILSLCKDKQKLESILSSDLRMMRAIKTSEGERTFVYNFEVDSNNEIDKNFIVFTKMYTPLLISNSHAAVVARGMGKCCVAGCGDVNIVPEQKKFMAKGKVIHEGDYISLDGSTGEVIMGEVGTTSPELSDNFEILMKWADDVSKLKVHANADTPQDATVARKFGAVGIGLCRTEHMFFEADRIDFVRGMILAENPEERTFPLSELKKMQVEDFKGILQAMEGLPVTIRLLDPPLHEFLPSKEDNEEIKTLSKKFNKSVQKIKTKINQLYEFNPMLGHRGCRLGITFPDIYKMQVEAIIESACYLKKKGINVKPEIMIPLVGNVKEFTILERSARKIAAKIFKECGVEIHYTIGTMIEIPRACLVADEIAKKAEFFSFGTNDLTQMGCGFSRDDAGKFLKEYVELGIYEKDPFQVLDRQGIGQLVKIAVEKGRKANPNLIIGICGEHGGEPGSIEFCHQVGLDYVSCSPYRVPIARLSAAQAAIR